ASGRQPGASFVRRDFRKRVHSVPQLVLSSAGANDDRRAAHACSGDRPLDLSCRGHRLFRQAGEVVMSPHDKATVLTLVTIGGLLLVAWFFVSLIWPGSKGA